MRQRDDARMKWELRVPSAKRPDGRPDWMSKTFYGNRTRRNACSSRCCESRLVDREVT